MRRDAEKDPADEPNALTAKRLLSQVDRKLVKQTVMTSVYGVTYIGARDQIKRRLKERSAIDDEAELFSAACYTAKTTLTALGEMFEAARDIMNWLGECAKTAFPPMMMTAIACKEAGLSFAGVHDSYWTHACDVDQNEQDLEREICGAL
ncbi:hypothetical protein Leryth_008049 [Lithospermum erythrorhizon]|nr:hypothetical protein Leryth_008049 [Lithospermum erythrorhizon]